jgi:hypothetical protein
MWLTSVVSLFRLLYHKQLVLSIKVSIKLGKEQKNERFKNRKGNDAEVEDGGTPPDVAVDVASPFAGS